jgi:hypothetical protein
VVARLPYGISRAFAEVSYSIFTFFASSDIFPSATAIRITLEKLEVTTIYYTLY